MRKLPLTLLGGASKTLSKSNLNGSPVSLQPLGRSQCGDCWRVGRKSSGGVLNERGARYEIVDAQRSPETCRPSRWQHVGRAGHVVTRGFWSRVAHEYCSCVPYLDGQSARVGALKAYVLDRK